MTRLATMMLALAALLGLSSCDAQPVLPIETGFAFTNLARDAYAALAIRVHDGAGSGAYHVTDLLAPGATTRLRFLDTLGVECPDALDFRVFTYRRVNEDTPIGLDPGEVLDATPEAAGEITAIPACAVQPLETFTIVNWDAPAGTARIKFAQATPVDTAIRASGIFPNSDAAWEIAGVAPSLADVAPPGLAESVPITGRVVDSDGTPWPNVGVLVRARFRVRSNDGDHDNDPDAGFGEPIDVTFTDTDGAFEFARPPGAYQVEVFADDLLFSPASVDVEAPQTALVFLAEAAE